ncbi:MAG: hypothetical protein F2808_07295 [Actinobacteria bacterium]|uniref:Unannotated protein n=1 Tax=freshwater metagenome TaxID=449393 RepID=A0A6J7GT96_9ZZZZ|nr:hypothetical protein [Actinomycetota bacterium]
MERPYSTPAGQNTTDMGTDYLKLLASGDTNHPWRLGRFNAAGAELHYDSGTSSWVDSTSPAYAAGPKWDDAGVVLALYADGYFYESYPRGYGLYISLSTTYSLGGEQTYTPTSVYNDCMSVSGYGEVAVAKSAAITSPSGGGGGGGGGGSSSLDLTLNLLPGAAFNGASTLIAGSNLAPTSAYDLTMHSSPIVIYSGVTDGSGNFSQTITIPPAACLPGVHELTLTGVDNASNPVSVTKYLELGYGCDILQLSDTPIIATAGMPDTGASIRTSIIVSVSAVVMFGLALFVYRSRRGLRFASVNERVVLRLRQLESSLTRMEQNSRKASARRRLRK